MENKLSMFTYQLKTPDSLVNEYSTGKLEVLISKGEKVSVFLQIPNLYAEVFAGPPWNEFTQCSQCQKYYGLSSKPGESSSCCNTQLVLAYPYEETAQYIQKELSMPNSTLALLLTVNNTLFGFSWGYEINLDDFLRRKYDNESTRELVKQIMNKLEITDFFYFSECGVKEDFRGKGYATNLTEIMINKARSLNLPMIMRTNCFSTMVAVAQRFGMTQILGPVSLVDKENKQINLTENIVNGIDTENLQRALFVLFP